MAVLLLSKRTMISYSPKYDKLQAASRKLQALFTSLASVYPSK
jgi:hypothetical protein